MRNREGQTCQWQWKGVGPGAGFQEMHTVGEVGLGRTGMPGRGLSSVLGGQEQPLRRTAREPGSGYQHTVQLSPSTRTLYAVVAPCARRALCALRALCCPPIFW